MSELKEAIERYTKHLEVILLMQHPKESPYTYIEVSTGAAGMVNEAWDKDAHTIARNAIALLASQPIDPTLRWQLCSACGSQTIPKSKLPKIATGTSEQEGGGA